MQFGVNTENVLFSGVKIFKTGTIFDQRKDQYGTGNARTQAHRIDNRVRLCLFNFLNANLMHLPSMAMGAVPPCKPAREGKIVGDLFELVFPRRRKYRNMPWINVALCLV